jgi:hypothetical protein
MKLTRPLITALLLAPLATLHAADVRKSASVAIEESFNPAAALACWWSRKSSSQHSSKTSIP